jgi:hypothetical protein
LKLGRKTRHQQAAKLAKCYTKQIRNEMKFKRDARKKEELKWEANGETAMAKWLSGGISKRDDREENPDRDT